MNPILARVTALAAGGYHPTAIRVSAANRGRWTVTITLDDFDPPGTTTDGIAQLRRELPPGVTLRGFERFPDDVTEIRGSAEAVESWLTEVARVGGAPDWARFDPVGKDVAGYPTYLTKPTKWLSPSNPWAKLKAFGEKLKALRESKHLSVIDLADAVGLTRQHIYQLESGQQQPSWESVQKLAEALGVSTDTFRE